MRFFGKARELAQEIEALVGVDLDLDRAAEAFAANRRRLGRGDAERLAARIRAAQEARDHRQYLSKALAERSIQPI